ncbi:conserved hypothetical protein [Candidatus Competibacter denitrificans Run_A_D11]|uniref:DUF1249 domain-containing protein n=1 Tax=Candidatus Competibacter denitrificans Run_A_D11 TaxID=1400863 RepID=W6M8T4_9GAMM|nr:DUF1249 domain-containing protein [Candidatus Competibacter denitrificans]CDI03987.1 conserved hypothetical protein [Candidatus Competibacter denitrificans Run_A_D11]HAS86577.1 DUF1249 domain-containing protein [Candidatus Competibacteraceae bacterium]HRC70308.1 DUF1249 domain-containing protein [Candidatus Competibacter denitrificans]
MILLPSPPLSSIIRHEPGAFAALMDLYENNYIHVRRLVPALPEDPTHLVSQVPDGLDLHFRLLERTRYTSEISLTYRFDQAGMLCVEPDLHIRVYHDAQLAEVLAAHLRHFPAFDAESLIVHRSDGAQLYRRWKINRFLFKWLQYCLRQGHRFTAPGCSIWCLT